MYPMHMMEWRGGLLEAGTSFAEKPAIVLNIGKCRKITRASAELMKSYSAESIVSAEI